MPKQLDRSKTAFLTQTSQKETAVSGVNAAEEISQLRQKAATENVVAEEVPEVEVEQQEANRPSNQEAQEIYQNYEQIQDSRQHSVVQVGSFLLI